MKLYHGTSEENYNSIKKDGLVFGPVFLTPKKDVAESYSTDGYIIEVDIDEECLLVDFDLAGQRLMTVDEANEYSGNDWSIEDYLENGFSVGTENNISL